MVGLANPGEEFAGTRHNIGGDAVRHLAERYGAGRLRVEKGLQSAVAQAQVGGQRVAMAVPVTYMNESGQAVRPLIRRFGIQDLGRLIVVHDELDLPPGRLRIKLGGGTAGHNGLRSVQSHLHSPDFVRVRIGIGKPPGRQQGADYVLRRPSSRDRQVLEESAERASDAIEQIVVDGLERAMTVVNGGT